MEYSEEHKDVVQHSESAKKGVKGDADSQVMPKIVPAPSEKPSDNNQSSQLQAEAADTSFADDLLTALFKTLFVALSLIAMLSCIIALAVPLKTMRLFNSWGMSERAVDFGERYISRELNSHKSADGKHTAAYTEKDGDMPVLGATAALTNDDFIEALYVCITLSDRMMTAALKSGDESRAKYYAERLERYSRTYLSLNSLSGVSLKTDTKNIYSVPAAVRPVVYSYEHDLRVLNYKARAVLGRTDNLPYNNRPGEVMTTVTERAETMFGAKPLTDEARVALIDNFVDYVGQLGAYLDVEFIRLGVETDLSKAKYKLDNGASVTVLNEIVINKLYGNRILDGDEFTLFIMPLKDVTETNNGFTSLFHRLSVFTQYAQWAVDTVPVEENGKLHQLYWLNVLSNVSKKLWYMEMLLHANMQVLGLNHDAIQKAYPTCERYIHVKSGTLTRQISEVYADKLKQYLAK
ncbi:MAG: hypothetical protein J1F71_01540 [Clostridiales bacterium]|nr:hypothetical protein [Clostridiales bacterium]